MSEGREAVWTCPTIRSGWIDIAGEIGRLTFANRRVYLRIQYWRNLIYRKVHCLRGSSACIRCRKGDRVGAGRRISNCSRNQRICCGRASTGKCPRIRITWFQTVDNRSCRTGGSSGADRSWCRHGDLWRFLSNNRFINKESPATVSQR